MNNMIHSLLSLKRDPLYNYIVPGLTSWLLVPKMPDGGCLRLFEMTRTQHEFIAPHSHRYAFNCHVLAGSVRNYLFKSDDEANDAWTTHVLDYTGTPGSYNSKEYETRRYFHLVRTYTAWQDYSMTESEIHSIHFSKGALVLFREFPATRNHSVMLTPYTTDTGTIPILRTEPWMFMRQQPYENLQDV